MRGYWSRVARRAASEAFGFLGWNRTTGAIAAASLLVGIAIRWMIAGWAAVTAEVFETVLYAIAPAVVVGTGAFICNMIRVPAHIEEELRNRLEPFNYDPELAQKLVGAINSGQRLLGQTRARHMGDSLEADFRSWCSEVSQLLCGRLPDHEVIGFETCTPPDFSLGDGVIATRIEKLRRIVMRYTKGVVSLPVDGGMETD